MVILRKFQPRYSLYYVALRVRYYQAYFTKYSSSFETEKPKFEKKTMKNLIFILLLGVFAINANAQNAPKKTATSKVITKQTVDIACGECQFKMKGKDCELAIKIDGKPYFVDGKSIDDFGDAHGEHGFCNATSKAEVTGELVNNRFKAREIKLLTNK